MDLRISEKKFVCVDYPGIVENHDTMLQTLGGAAEVTKTYRDPAKQLELSFRQKDAGCKPLSGTRQTCKGLLLRVRRHRHKDVSSVDTQGTDDTAAQFHYSGEVIGMVDTVYKFQSLSDFQYLLADRDPDGTYKDIHDNVYLTGLQSRSWLDEQTPLCLLPQQFSRFDRPVMYCYREPPVHRSGYEKSLPKLDPNVIGVSRKRRSHHTQFVPFTVKDVPTEPNEAAVEILQNKRVSSATVDQIQKVFERQPIWSRNALLVHLSSSISHHIVRATLPTLAYYFSSGPWRSMWVRFGYDPRTDPKAKMYQTLDVRIPRHIADEGKFEPKRSIASYRAPNSRIKHRGQPAIIQRSIFDTSETGDKELPSVSQDPRYRFRPGVVPAFRQMIYQLCNVDEPEVQRLVHENDGQETECLEKDGWCRPETVDKCRTLLNTHLSSLLKASTTDGASVRSTPAVTEDGGSSGAESELNEDDDDNDSDNDEQQNSEANEDQNGASSDDSDSDDNDDNDDDTVADNEQLETDIMKQLGIFS